MDTVRRWLCQAIVVGFAYRLPWVSAAGSCLQVTDGGIVGGCLLTEDGRNVTLES